MAKDKKKTSEIAEASAVEETKSTKKAKNAEAKSGKKNAKKDEGKKRNVFQSIAKWFHDLGVEFRNVTWPTKQTVAINTSVVLFVIVAGSIFVGLLDLGLFKLMQFLIGLSQ